MRLIIAALSTCLAVATLVAADHAAYYVAPNGSDANSCAQAKVISGGVPARPKRTIASAAECMAGGDAMYIRAGDYPVQLGDIFPAGSADAYTRIAGFPGDPKPRLIPGILHADYVVHFQLSASHHIEFDGLSAEWASWGGGGFARVETISAKNPHHIRFKNMTIIGVPDGHAGEGLYSSHAFQFTQNAPDASAQGGNELLTSQIQGGCDRGDFCYGLYNNARETVVDGNEIEDMSGAGIQHYSGYGFANTGFVARNNRIHDIVRSADNRTYGIVIASPVSHALVYNNVIAKIGNTESVGIRSYSGDVQVLNNTVTRVTGNGKSSAGIQLMDSARGAVVRNNISWNNFRNYQDLGAGNTQDHNVFTDPGFVNAAAGDFRLTGLIKLPLGAGANVNAVATDISGARRASQPTVGAYEYRTGGR